jgi:hypothetical protein
MNSVLLVLALILSAAVVVLAPSLGASAIVVCVVVAIVAGACIRASEVEHREFLLQIFAVGLLARVAVATALHVLKYDTFFGPDVETYDFFGNALAQYWNSATYHTSAPLIKESNLGMSYTVGAIYFLVGRNPLAVQLFNAVLGASTAPLIYLCAYHIFQNIRVSKLSAWLVALFPSLVLWSSIGLKDAAVVFLIALTMFSTLRLSEGFSVLFLSMLSVSMVCLFSLRFYIFYMMLLAVVGCFVFGARAFSGVNLVRQFLLLIVVGLVLTYMGVLRNASKDIETYSDLEKIQNMRVSAANMADSGFGKDVDVSTTSGALTAIPLGLLFILFAPFPWQLASARQMFTIPEMVVWWASFPLLLLGLWYSIKYVLRQATPILIFTMLTTLVYSIFQSNVGTAYRQRSQLLVFYLIFVAVGYVVWQERKENQKKPSK